MFHRSKSCVLSPNGCCVRLFRPLFLHCVSFRRPQTRRVLCRRAEETIRNKSNSKNIYDIFLVVTFDEEDRFCTSKWTKVIVALIDCRYCRFELKKYNPVFLKNNNTEIQIRKHARVLSLLVCRNVTVTFRETVPTDHIHHTIHNLFTKIEPFV